MLINPSKLYAQNNGPPIKVANKPLGFSLYNTIARTMVVILHPIETMKNLSRHDENLIHPFSLWVYVVKSITVIAFEGCAERVRHSQQGFIRCISDS
jgi:hypothetical protein